MGFRDDLKENNALMAERTELVVGRIKEMLEEKTVEDKYIPYFKKMAERMLTLEEYYALHESGKIKTLSMDELKAWNERLFGEIAEGKYETCYGNPEYAVKEFGELGQIFSYLYYELAMLKDAAVNGFREQITVYEELIVEIYNRFEDNDTDINGIKEVIRGFNHDNCEIYSELRSRLLFDPEVSCAKDIVKEADPNDLRYLYWYGKNVTENEIETAKFINSLSEEEVRAMAHTYVDGFLVGYSKMGQDIHNKSEVSMYFNLGFERMIRFAMEEFAKEGIECVLPSLAIGTTPANRQFGFDHKEDRALYLDKAYVERTLETLRQAYESVKKCMNGYAGPAVIETFGEKEFNPKNKKEALHYDDKQKKLAVSLAGQQAKLSTEYINPEERSFTIIAYPIPEIGPKFKEIFAATVKVNTLDASLYEKIQQTIIDCLDEADYVEVKGRNGNHTDLVINIPEIKDRTKQTAFENCVADVNIPVGEVFTSPKLEGTNGVLHVKEVYLEGFKVNNLEITLKDGMITSYTCSNNEKEEDNKDLLNLLIMKHHETLPIGEFAIGTNTTAYKMGIDYDCQAQLPILISEKTGPHFAMGDTCFSREEEVETKNPDGKVMIAKENSVSALRNEDPDKAYMNCHTDITIPYNELDTITVVRYDGSRVNIIEGGYFVLPGTEELNKPLNELYGTNK